MKDSNFKRNFVAFGRIIKTGCINFVRNAWLSVAAIAVMLITLTIVLFSVIANATFTNTIQQITDKIDISVYLKDSVTGEQKDALIAQLQSQENVKQVTYRTKEESRDDFSKDKQDDISVQQGLLQLDENPIPATIHVKPRNPNEIESIRQFLEKTEIKEMQARDSSYSGQRKEAIDKITGATRFFRQAGVIGVVVFAFISMMIIFNTIQMAIFNRREEITIMRLLGASTNYIRGPFIVETIVYGVVSAILSIVSLNALFAASSKTLEASSLGLLDINYSYEYFGKNFWLFLTSQLGIGIFIGAASSLIATRRYLKFKSTTAK